MKFSIGDRVKILTDSNTIHLGDYGTINNNEAGGFRILFINGDKEFFASHEIEREKIRNTKIARKLNPNYKVIDKDWIEL